VYELVVHRKNKSRQGARLSNGWLMWFENSGLWFETKARYSHYPCEYLCHGVFNQH